MSFYATQDKDIDEITVYKNCIFTPKRFGYSYCYDYSKDTAQVTVTVTASKKIWLTTRYGLGYG